MGRSRLVAVYDFIPEAGGTTRVELTTFSEPKTAIDRLRQSGAHRWIRRKTKTRPRAPAQDLRGAERRGARPGDRRGVRAGDRAPLRSARPGERKAPGHRRVDCPPRGSEPPQKDRRGLRPGAHLRARRSAPVTTRSRASTSRPARAWRSTSGASTTTSSSRASSTCRSRPTRPTTRVAPRRPAARCTACSYRPATRATSSGGPPTTSRSRTTRATSSSRSRCRGATPFAYHPRLLGKEDCIPESGSVAQLGPTAGSMLLFQFPLQNTENRPLGADHPARARLQARPARPLAGRLRRCSYLPSALPSTIRAAGAAVAPPEPFRTSSTATAILGAARGGERREPRVGVVRDPTRGDRRPPSRGRPPARRCRSCRPPSRPGWRPRCPCRTGRRPASASRSSRPPRASSRAPRARGRAAPASGGPGRRDSRSSAPPRPSRASWRGP